MKTEELTAIGLTDEQAKQVLAMNGRDIEKHKGDISTLQTQLKTATDQLAEANGKLEGYDPEWKAKADAASKEAAEKVDKLKFEHTITAALTGAKAKNVKAVRALLDENGLKLNGDEVVGLNEQLEKIKADADYLFERDKPAPVFSRSATGTQATTGGSDDKKAQANAALRSLFGKDG